MTRFKNLPNCLYFPILAKSKGCNSIIIYLCFLLIFLLIQEALDTMNLFH